MVSYYKVTRDVVTYVYSQVTLRVFLIMFLMFIYFLRETEYEQGRGKRERETQNRKQAPGSEPSAQNPTWGSNPRTVRS